MDHGQASRLLLSDLEGWIDELSGRNGQNEDKDKLMSLVREGSHEIVVVLVSDAFEQKVPD